MLEVVAVSVAGGLLGWLVGVLASWALLPYFSQTDVAFGLEPALALYTVAAALAVGAMSSIYPTVRASKLDPSEAIRYV
jgi:putative ABC transport system permease protein